MRQYSPFALAGASVMISVAIGFGGAGKPEMIVTANESGIAATVSNSGIDQTNPFFRSVGTNGRACVTCHQPGAGWTITPANVQIRFAITAGRDPLFRTNDGSDSPLAGTSTMEQKRAAYSMLLSKALLRVGMPVPAGAEFELTAVDDPYGFASASELSLFRRPLPATNLRFLTAVMWDGRETIKPIKTAEELTFNLAHQAVDATLGHAQAVAPPTSGQVQQIVAFELGLATAQGFDKEAGPLSARGAAGGPVALTNQRFFIGINDPLGGNPAGEPFNPEAMTLFAAWRKVRELPADREDAGDAQNRNDARQTVARGEELFNTRSFAIGGVAGLNDVLNVAVLRGTCTTCHSSPNVGNHSVPLAINIGISDASRRTPDQPLYTLRNKLSGATVRTTDPGRALVTGKWADIGKFKGPVLRGLAARAPYFHNGSAASLSDVVEFYDTRFAIGFTAGERQDLVAFLRSL